MKSHLMRGLLVALFAIPILLIASCSKKDKGTNPDNSGAPTLTFPQFSQTVNFVGNSSLQAAKDKVNAQIALVNPWLATPKSIATALNAGQWGTKANGCWSKNSAQSNCTTTYQMCDSTAGSYAWSRTQNGNCSGVDHANWVDVDGTRSADGGSGLIRAFKNNTTNVDSTWTWSTAGDQNSKNWKVYAGADAPANLVAQLQWTKGAGNGNNWTFQQLGTFSLAAGASTVPAAKWTLTASSDSKTGTMDIYAWSAGTSAGAESFWRSDHIAWNPDSSGSWTEYGQQGNVVTEHHWPQTGPDIEIATVGHDIVFDTTTQCAKDAYQIAEPGIQSAQAWLTVGRDYFHYLDSLNPGGPVNGCWTWSGASGEGCTAEFKVCQEGSDYHWTWKLNGSCSGTSYSNWVGFEGVVSSDGKTGLIKIYTPNTTTVAYQTSWSTETDGSTDLIFELIGAAKWVTHESADGTSGSTQYYLWHDTPTPGYWLFEQVNWNSDGSGTSIMYMEDGTIMQQCSWT